MPLGGTTDPLIDLLKAQGYSLVLVPRTGVRPLQLLTREGGRYVKLGELTDLFHSDEPLPVLLPDEPAGAISGSRTEKLDAGIALTLLEGLLQAMGGNTIGLKVGYERARSAVFEFQDVARDSVDILPLNRWIARASVDPGSSHVQKLLEADRIYVLLATLKTDRLTMETFTARGAHLELGVPQLQGLIGGSVVVVSSTERRSRITFMGPAKLVFGFQALRLFYKDGKFTAFRVASPGSGALRALTGGLIGDKLAPEFLLPEGCFLPLAEDHADF